MAVCVRRNRDCLQPINPVANGARRLARCQYCDLCSFGCVDIPDCCGEHRKNPLGRRVALARLNQELRRAVLQGVLKMARQRVKGSFACGSGFRLRAPASLALRACFAHARKTAQVRFTPGPPEKNRRLAIPRGGRPAATYPASRTDPALISRDATCR